MLRTSDVQTRFRVVLVLYGHYTTRCVQIARRCNVTHGRAAGDFVSTNTSTIRVESVCVWTEHSLTVTLNKVIYLYITLFSLVSKHSYLFFNNYSFIFRFFWTRSSSDIHSEIEESQAHTSSDVHPEIEDFQVNDSDIFEDCNIISSDRGNFDDNSSECERKLIFKLGPFKPQGPFPKDSESNRPFSAYYYSYFNQASIKLVDHGYVILKF